MKYFKKNRERWSVLLLDFGSCIYYTLKCRVFLIVTYLLFLGIILLYSADSMSGHYRITFQEIQDGFLGKSNFFMCIIIFMVLFNTFFVIQIITNYSGLLLKFLSYNASIFLLKYNIKHNDFTNSLLITVTACAILLLIMNILGKVIGYSWGEQTFTNKIIFVQTCTSTGRKEEK